MILWFICTIWLVLWWFNCDVGHDLMVVNFTSKVPVLHFLARICLHCLIFLLWFLIEAILIETTLPNIVHNLNPELRLIIPPISSLIFQFTTEELRILLGFFRLGFLNSAIDWIMQIFYSQAFFSFSPQTHWISSHTVVLHVTIPFQQAPKVEGERVH